MAIQIQQIFKNNNLIAAKRTLSIALKRTRLQDSLYEFLLENIILSLFPPPSVCKRWFVHAEG